VLAVSLVAVAVAPAGAHALELPAGFSDAEVTAGLDGPTALAYAPDGRLFIAEKAGRVRVVNPGGWLQPRPVIDISDHVNAYWDRGLLGIAVDAEFATNHFVYLLYVHEADPEHPEASKTSRLTRITVTSSNRPENPAAPETVLLGSVAQAPCPAAADTVDCIPADGFSHAIGTVRADPDGTLWIGSGDASGFWGADPKAVRTYDERSFAGKLIHVDRQGRGVPGHPFCPGETDLTKVCTKLYAKGFRNPFRFQLRPGAGPLVGDVGWNGREEINLARPGRSYGWPCYEGTRRTPSYQDLPACVAQYDLGPAAHDLPAYEYPHVGNAAIVAGPRYEGTQYPAAYRGAWYFGDYANGTISRMTIDAQGAVTAVQPFATGFEGGVDLERGPDGDLVYVRFGEDAGSGSVQRIVYGNQPPVASAAARPSRGVAPLAVTLSAEGSADPDGDALTYEWDLDDDGSSDAVGPSVSHTYEAGAHTAVLRVRDARGLTATDAVEVLADETPPVAAIRAPAPGATFRYGRPIVLEGAGMDTQDGELGDAALHWRITIHHGNHAHLIEADRTGRELSFTPPGDHDADSFLEFRLTARDSAGLESSRTLTMEPEKIALRLESSPPGAVLSYAGVDVVAPALRTAAVGFRTTVSAPATLAYGGQQFVFDRWSDGGARLHDLVVPPQPTTLTAAYRPLSAPPVSGVLGTTGGSPSRRAAPRVRLSKPAAGRVVRRLRGRIVGASGRVRIDVALRQRQRAASCRWWRRPLGRLSGAARACDRPVWMRAAVDRSGRWRVDLRGRLGRGRYVVLMRARPTSKRARVLARATTGVRIASGGPDPRAMR